MDDKVRTTTIPSMPNLSKNLRCIHEVAPRFSLDHFRQTKTKKVLIFSGHFPSSTPANSFLELLWKPSRDFKLPMPFLMTECCLLRLAFIFSSPHDDLQVPFPQENSRQITNVQQTPLFGPIPSSEESLAKALRDSISYRGFPTLLRVPKRLLLRNTSLSQIHLKSDYCGASLWNLVTPPFSRNFYGNTREANAISIRKLFARTSSTPHGLSQWNHRRKSVKSKRQKM